MSFVAVAIGGGALVSGTLGYLGATSAANTQANAANNALQFQEQTYNANQPRINAANAGFDTAQTTANNSFQPWLTSGSNANYTMSQLMGGGGGNTQPDYSSFFNSPDYQFAQQQGQKGVINAANAQGIGLSGGTLKDLDSFNSGLATQQYGNYFNRLMQMSNNGLSAASGLTTASTNIAGGRANLATGAASANNASASTIGNTMQGVGQAQASGIVGGTNAITGSINSGISNSLLANYLGKSPSAYGSSPATGPGSPTDAQSNSYAMSQGINPFSGG